ncbi:MAG TPA: hypothetical protein VGU45_13625 [Microvirga sp.]|jgi:hypothetical protein|nr:hypothetical protein [Microvirga sp.]
MNDSTRRVPRQRERLARDLEPAASTASPATSPWALSADELVAEHAQGSLLSQREFDTLTAGYGIQPVALDFEHDGYCNPLRRHSIVPCGRLFEFARDAKPNERTDAALTLLVIGSCGTPIDIVAFRPKPYRHLCLLGRAAVIGEHQVLRPLLSRGLRVHRTILGYLAHGRRGIVILNPAPAALMLHGIHLIPEDPQHRDELRLLVAGPVVLEPGED